MSNVIPIGSRLCVECGRTGGNHHPHCPNAGDARDKRSIVFVKLQTVRLVEVTHDEDATDEQIKEMAEQALWNLELLDNAVHEDEELTFTEAMYIEETEYVDEGEP